MVKEAIINFRAVSYSTASPISTNPNIFSKYSPLPLPTTFSSSSRLLFRSTCIPKRLMMSICIAIALEPPYCGTDNRPESYLAQCFLNCSSFSKLKKKSIIRSSSSLLAFPINRLSKESICVYKLISLAELAPTEFNISVMNIMECGSLRKVLKLSTGYKSNLCSYSKNRLFSSFKYTFVRAQIIALRAPTFFGSNSSY